MDCSPAVHRILQTKILELPFPSPGDLPNPRTKPVSLTCLVVVGVFFATWEVLIIKVPIILRIVVKR